ncbi:hypothetical protein MMC18_001413 [Xylographa bjoerkii]|nr:hypothetical protein [Xylographa bjoerkii]
MEAKFESLKKDMSELSAAEIRERLTKTPKATESEFFQWLVQASSTKAFNQLNGKPDSNSITSEKIIKTDFKDPASIFELYRGIFDVVCPEPLQLGKMTAASQTYFYSVNFEPDLLPDDIQSDEAHIDTCLTYLERSPESGTEPASPPPFSFALGRLRYTTSEKADPKTAQDTNFVVVVSIADKKAWALWNPSSGQPSGRLPGFTKTCIAFPFEGASVDALLPGTQSAPPKTLTIDPNKLVVLPSTGAVKYGGVNKAGWDRLVRVSPKFADAARVTQRI